MVQRMSGPEGITATALSREVGIAQPTLSRWLREAPMVRAMARKKKASKGRSARAPRRTAEDKLRLVLQASALSDEELGAFLRREGVHESQLQEWRAAAMAALSPPSKRSGSKTSPETKRVRALERELTRKEKALAEAAALLVLQKKVRAIWGDGDDDTPTRSGT